MQHLSSSSEEGELDSSNDSSESGIGNQDLLQFVEVKSKRGASLLARGGFEYQFERDSAMIDNVEYWRCIKRPPYCPGRVHVHSPWHENDGIRFKLGLVKNAQHTHNADPDKEYVRNAIEHLKQRAREPNPAQVRDTVDAARAALAEEVRVNAPSSTAMAKIYQREKRKAAEQFGDRGLDAMNPLDIVIPQHLEPTVLLNENVNIAGQLRKIVVFAAQSALQMLDRYRGEIAIDGTFRTAPRGFVQLFTIHVVEDFCAILPGREEANYGQGCDGWLRAWIEHENLAQRTALFPIEALGKKLSCYV